MLSSPPFTGGKICDRDQIDHGGARQKYKRGFPPSVEMQIKTNKQTNPKKDTRKKKTTQQPREACNYSTISYSFNEITYHHSANRRISAGGGVQI